MSLDAVVVDEIKESRPSNSTLNYLNVNQLCDPEGCMPLVLYPMLYLDEGRQSAVLRKAIFEVPSDERKYYFKLIKIEPKIQPPVSTRKGPSNSSRGHVSSWDPGRNLLQLHLKQSLLVHKLVWTWTASNVYLAKGNIFLPIEDGRVIRAMDSLAVSLGKLTKRIAHCESANKVHLKVNTRLQTNKF